MLINATRHSHAAGQELNDSIKKKNNVEPDTTRKRRTKKKTENQTENWENEKPVLKSQSWWGSTSRGDEKRQRDGGRERGDSGQGDLLICYTSCLYAKIIVAASRMWINFSGAPRPTKTKRNKKREKENEKKNFHRILRAAAAAWGKCSKMQKGNDNKT